MPNIVNNFLYYFLSVLGFFQIPVPISLMTFVFSCRISLEKRPFDSDWSCAFRSSTLDAYPEIFQKLTKVEKSIMALPPCPLKGKREKENERTKQKERASLPNASPCCSVYIVFYGQTNAWYMLFGCIANGWRSVVTRTAEGPMESTSNQFTCIIYVSGVLYFYQARRFVPI